jgi:hypothetical protein
MYPVMIALPVVGFWCLIMFSLMFVIGADAAAIVATIITVAVFIGILVDLNRKDKWEQEEKEREKEIQEEILKIKAERIKGIF